MKNYSMTNVQQNVVDLMGKASKGLKDLQPTKIGQKEKSKREINALWKKIQESDPGDTQAIMNEIAILSGHEGPGLDGCDLCKMITSKVIEKVNK